MSSFSCFSLCSRGFLSRRCSLRVGSVVSGHEVCARCMFALWVCRLVLKWCRQWCVVWWLAAGRECGCPQRLGLKQARARAHPSPSCGDGRLQRGDLCVPCLPTRDAHTLARLAPSRPPLPFPQIPRCAWCSAGGGGAGHLRVRDLYGRPCVFCFSWGFL